MINHAMKLFIVYPILFRQSCLVTVQFKQGLTLSMACQAALFASPVGALEIPLSWREIVTTMTAPIS